MKDTDIQIAKIYDITVGKNTSTVRITKCLPTGGWEAVTVSSNKTIVIKSAKRILRLHKPKGDTQPKPRKSPHTGHPGPQNAPDKPLSALDAAAVVLKAESPLNCRQMIERMAAAGLWTSSAATPANTLHAAIAKEIRVKGDDSRFAKVDRGQFALNN